MISEGPLRSLAILVPGLASGTFLAEGHYAELAGLAMGPVPRVPV